MTLPALKIAGEGHLDLAILRRLAHDAGFAEIEPYGIRGKSFIDRRLPNWNKAAEFSPWLVLRDLDNDADCAPSLRRLLLPIHGRHMCFRIAVRQIESWLLADRDMCRSSLGFREKDIPADAEMEANAKLCLLIAASRSSDREIRDGVVVRMKSGQLVEGDNYNALLSNFVDRKWRSKIAARNCRSLHKALHRLNELKSAVT